MHKNARHSHQVWRKEIDSVEHILWTATNSQGGIYIAVFNTGSADSEIEIPLTDIEIYDKVYGTELWSGKAISAKESLKIKLESHEAKAFLLNTQN